MQDLLTAYAYPFIITVVAAGFYLAGSFSILNKRNRRLKKARKVEVYDTISGETPSQIDDDEILNMGIDSIKSRFSFIQKLFPIGMFFLWLVALVIPYLSTMPAIYISLLVAVVSVTMGIALRPFLENIVAGVIISFFQPFRVGDTVRIEDHYGVIERIDLAQCVLRVWDWKRFVIPNSKMLTKEIQNLTMHDSFIWAHVAFHVEPECDLERVEELAKRAARDSKHILEREEPVFWVTKLEKDSVECWVAAWADNPPEAWELRCDIRRDLQKFLKAEGIKFQAIQAQIQTSQSKQAKAKQT